MTTGGDRLAMYNFGLHVGPYDAPEVQGFLSREPANFAAAERAAGFVGRSGYPGQPGPGSWGPQVFPRFIQGSGFDSAPSSLSLWRDIESLMAFTYAGVHADALKNARNWNVKGYWPPLVLWWVEPDRSPDWREGADRLHQLHDDGPGPGTFTFKNAFDPDGLAYEVDRDRVKLLIGENVPGQADLLEKVLAMPV